jgi:hypothetical protein
VDPGALTDAARPDLDPNLAARRLRDGEIVATPRTAGLDEERGMKAVQIPRRRGAFEVVALSRVDRAA